MSSDSFDFWLGTWDVGWDGADGKRQKGTNTISIVDGTVRELFTDADPGGAYIGASVSHWDAAAGLWEQDYWDNRGYSAVFRGNRAGDRMVLERVPREGSGALTRLVWSEITADTIRWTYDRQEGDGSWVTTWLIDYSRQQSPEV